MMAAASFNVNQSLGIVYDGLLMENISMVNENRTNKFAMQFYLNLPARTSSKKLIYMPFELKSATNQSNSTGFHFR